MKLELNLPFNYYCLSIAKYCIYILDNTYSGFNMKPRPDTDIASLRFIYNLCLYLKKLNDGLVYYFIKWKRSLNNFIIKDFVGALI